MRTGVIGIRVGDDVGLYLEVLRQVGVGRGYLVGN